MISHLGLIQHDRIKIELTQLDLIPILIRCVTEEKFDVIKIRQEALEMLLSLSFGDWKIKSNHYWIMMI
jgi:hypothetical protein